MIKSVNPLIRCFFILFFLCCCYSAFAFSGGLFYEFQMPFFEFSNSVLNCHYIGAYTYSLTPGFQQTGWFFGGLVSTIDPAVNVLGGLVTGVLLAQEIRIGIISLVFSIWPGFGIDVSDLGHYPAHLYLWGEAQVGLNVFISSWMQVGVYGGLQGFGNLFPLVPFQEYAFYSPTIGFKVIWE